MTPERNPPSELVECCIAPTSVFGSTMAGASLFLAVLVVLLPDAGLEREDVVLLEPELRVPLLRVPELRDEVPLRVPPLLDAVDRVPVLRVVPVLRLVVLRERVPVLRDAVPRVPVLRVPVLRVPVLRDALVLVDLAPDVLRVALVPPVDRAVALDCVVMAFAAAFIALDASVIALVAVVMALVMAVMALAEDVALVATDFILVAADLASVAALVTLVAAAAELRLVAADVLRVVDRLAVLLRAAPVVLLRAVPAVLLRAVPAVLLRAVLDAVPARLVVPVDRDAVPAVRRTVVRGAVAVRAALVVFLLVGTDLPPVLISYGGSIPPNVTVYTLSADRA